MEKLNSRLREWRPWVIVAGLAVVVVVDSVMFFVANNGFPGVVENDYYDKGLYYNEYMEKLRLQKLRGWQVDLGWVGTPRQGSPAVLRCTAKDKNGVPITGAQSTVKLRRPGGPSDDQDLHMSEVAPGVYEVKTILNRPGNWDLILNLQRGKDTQEKQSELWVLPKTQ